MSKSATSWYQITGSTKLIKIHLNTRTARLLQRSLKKPWKSWRTRSLLAQTKLPMRRWKAWNQSKVQTPGNLQQQLEDRACSSELARNWHGTHPQEGQGSSKHGQLSPYQPHQLCGQTQWKNDQHSPGMAPEEQHHHSRAGRLSAAPFYWRPGDRHCPEDRGWLSG